MGTIQARMGSTRLPGKVLKPIEGKPMLLWQIERLRRSRLLDEIVVGTSVNPGDDPIAELCDRIGAACFRGSEDDVLNRIASLIKQFNVDVHVEFFGDSILTDPHLIDEAIGLYLKHQGHYDCVYNASKISYPPGQEVLVHRGELLVEADERIRKDDPLREHVSIHMTKNPSVRVLNLEAPPYYNFPEIYLEVDTQEDFTLISTIIGHFAKRGEPHFSLAQILDYLRVNRELAESNRLVERRWKKFKE